MKEVRVKRRNLLAANIILMIISIIGCKYIFEVETTKKVYAAETVKILEENRNPVFAIEKIYLQQPTNYSYSRPTYNPYSNNYYSPYSKKRVQN